MIPQKPKYFILIVHYGDPALTHACISSLLSGEYLPDNIIVIDQAQAPFSLQEKELAVCQVIRPAQNNGYAGGVNIGLGALISLGAEPQDVVLVMNNDVLASSHTLHVLAAWFDGCEEPVLAGAQRWRTNLFTGRAKHTKNLTPSAMSVSYVDGAFLAARYDVWLRLKGIPDNYFLYWEDVLLSQRARLQRIKLATIAGLGLRHPVKAPSGDALFYLVRNGALFLTQETGIIWRIYWRLGTYFRLWWHKLQSPSPTEHTILAALRAAARSETGKRL